LNPSFAPGFAYIPTSDGSISGIKRNGLAETEARLRINQRKRMFTGIEIVRDHTFNRDHTIVIGDA
jgi:hypothetical protein